MWLYGTLKMRLFENENQDLGKISPTFFSHSDNFDVKTEDVMYMKQLSEHCATNKVM